MDIKHTPPPEGDQPALPTIGAVKDISAEVAQQDDEESAAPTSEPFCWTNDADAVTIPEQQAIAVYLGSSGHIIVRQQADFCEEYDPIISVRPTYAAALAKAIVALTEGE